MSHDGVRLDERIRQLTLSVERLQKMAGILARLDINEYKAAEIHWIRKESSICLKRALALWWGLRWGRRQ